ncbi:MAG TPA: 50S ribosomal protein L11 methyltransferase [Candidatus Limnocylindrales bacterium]
MSVSADHEAVEQVSEILSRVCPGGVTVEAPFELVDEGLAARVDTRRPATVRGYISAVEPAAARAAVKRARDDLAHLQAFQIRPIGELETRVVHEEDWTEAWKQHFPVMRVGHRLVIRPTWREHEPTGDDVVISLDPGMAFGTGLHPTTRLCMALIDDLAGEGLFDHASVLDVGCGSGILSICAGLLGAALVLGVDTDPLAVETTRRNARLNGLSRVIEARTGSVPLADDETHFDIVLANLIASLLVDLAVPLSYVVRPGGRLVASGIFRDREPDVRNAFESAGLRIVDRRSETDWVALVAERPA